MFDNISLLSLQLYLNWLVFDQNIFGSSSVVFSNLQLSSEMLEKCSEMFVWPWNINNFGNLWKSLEIFGRQSEIFGKLSKTASSARLYNKKNITRWLEDMNFMFSWQELSAFSLSFLRRRSFVKSRRLWIQRTHTMGFSPSFLSGDGSGGMLPRKIYENWKAGEHISWQFGP